MTRVIKCESRNLFHNPSVIFSHTGIFTQVVKIWFGNSEIIPTRMKSIRRLPDNIHLFTYSRGSRIVVDNTPIYNPPRLRGRTSCNETTERSIHPWGRIHTGEWNVNGRLAGKILMMNFIPLFVMKSLRLSTCIGS
uniref:Uncharacterized protein n=1 Tax=Lepeophtheirus salmonis TaxID=72036 RepID=A0A0K2UD53_LEPSM